mmetsp:Transcript_37334/g.52705  ORF Transcript_37334/g.52705 Transcript_37334/m.52705 type:complete len:222 (+) Transcript_37334:957-1622(+)
MGSTSADDLVSQTAKRHANHDRMKSRRLSMVTRRQDKEQRMVSVVHQSRKLQELLDIERLERAFNNIWEPEAEEEGDSPPEITHTVKTYAIQVGETTQEVNADNLSEKWLIGHEAADWTLWTTTQFGVRRLVTPAARRFWTQMKHLRYPTLPGIWYGDTMHFNVKSIDSHLHAHVLGNGKGYVRFFPMETKNETHYALDDFIKRVGAPEYLLTDNDPTMKG